jgi:hypothetical protein
MSTPTLVTFRRATLALLALAAVGSTTGAQAAATIWSLPSYVPADAILTAPGAPAPKQVASAPHKDDRKSELR